MSNILYSGALRTMSFSEKSSWIYAVVSLVFPATYVIFMAGELQRTPAADVAFQVPILSSIGSALVAVILAHIVLVIAGRAEAGKTDERDRAIDHHGEYATGLALATSMIGVLALVLLEVEYVWIASAMYLAMALSGFIGAVVKIVAYRRGLRSW